MNDMFHCLVWLGIKLEELLLAVVLAARYSKKQKGTVDKLCCMKVCLAIPKDLGGYSAIFVYWLVVCGGTHTK
jgi:hypothetical protein